MHTLHTISGNKCIILQLLVMKKIVHYSLHAITGEICNALQCITITNLHYPMSVMYTELSSPQKGIRIQILTKHI